MLIMVLKLKAVLISTRPGKSALLVYVAVQCRRQAWMVRTLLHTVLPGLLPPSVLNALIFNTWPSGSLQKEKGT